ncbi:MAG: sulfatase [Sedimentisphaerales bacterium]|nr:sulfatase [Sedimentisphaerales bacterium]
MKIEKTNRRRFLKAVAAGAATLALPRSISLARATGRPNILFIMADDHAVNAVSCYGSRLGTVAKTPNIDRIAAEGARLVNCLCTNSICVPSRATILTGQYSHVNGVYTLADRLDPEKQNVAKILHAAGYQTALFGKWHLKSDPAGFDDWNILPGQGRYHNPLMREKPTEKQPGDKKALDTQSNAEKVNDANQPTEPNEASDPYSEEDRTEEKSVGLKTHKGFSTDVITDLSLEWLKKRDKKKPFLLMTHFKSPHAPWHFAERHAEMYKDVEIPEPESLFENLMHRSAGSREYGFRIDEALLQQMQNDDYPTGKLDTTGMSPEQKARTAYQKYLKDYLRCVAAIDENVGKLLEFLREQNLEDNTVVIYTSDQGLFLGEHGYIDKRWMYEESLRMPFLMRYPPLIRPETVNDDIIINADFAPTLLDLAGITAPAEMQGRSFRDNLRSRTPADWRTAMYYRYWQHGSRPAHYGIRTDRYKLIFFYGLPLNMKGAEKTPTKVGWELYDLKRDPFETNNIYGHPAYRRVQAGLKKNLTDLKAELGDTDDKYPELTELTKKYW